MLGLGQTVIAVNVVQAVKMVSVTSKGRVGKGVAQFYFIFEALVRVF